jgi:signal transduction histidine kinase/DNA-binding response OmpR family regulator
MRPAQHDTRTGVHILVVGQRAAERGEMLRVLEQHAGAVSTVETGAEAFALLRRSRPAVVVCDAATPGLDGYSLCRQIKSRRELRDTAVILSVPLERRAESLMCLECGADGFLAAPYDGEALWARVRYVLANRRPAGPDEAEAAVDFTLCGQRHRVRTPPARLLDLLVSAYEAAVRTGTELSEARQSLGALNVRLEQQVQAREAALAARKLAEEELWRAREKTRSILDRSGMAVCLIGPQLEVLEFNKRMGEWFPALHGAGKAHCCGTLCHATSRDRCPDCPVALALRDGRVHETLRREVREGKPVVYRLVASAMRDADGALQGAIAMVDDVTRVTQLEEQLAQTARLEAIGMLAGGVAHDFNNLLVIINGYSRMMADSLPPQNPLRRDAEQVLNAGERAANLTRQLLAFSRRQNLEPRVLNINRLTEDVAQVLGRIIGEDVELRCNLGAGVGHVHADPAQLEQVLLNLAVNARDAMPAGGLLTIETAAVTLDAPAEGGPGPASPGPYVMLSVSDTGCGMAPEVAQHVFEPFFTTKEAGKGTGLGLAMVYGTVKQHGGHIELVSQPGHGATFRIYLPEVDASTESLVQHSSRPEPLRGTETVLLVEDEESVRALAERVLQHYGYRVISAADPAQAKELFSRPSQQVELLLTDVVMPGCDGPTLCKRLRAQSPLLRVLYVSGYTEGAQAGNGFRDPGSGFLQKPFTPDALARKVREVLDASSLAVL